MNKKIFFPLLIILSLAIPAIVSAQIGPLVICGTKSTPECTFCDIFRMLQTVINFIWWILLIIAPLFLIVGGIMILTAGLKPEQVESGKRIITGTLIGLAIALLSWTILNVIFNTLANQGSQGFPWPWNQIQCTGGGVATTQSCSSDTECKGLYCDTLDTHRCVTAENLTCYSWMDCPNPYDCNPYTSKCYTSLFCCCNLPGNTFACDSFGTYTECQIGCLAHCQANHPGFTSSCCLSQNAACAAGTVTGRCGQRSAAGACTFNSRFTCMVGVNDQISDTSLEMLQFLNCMATFMITTYPTLSPSSPEFTISSLTDNSGIGSQNRCAYNWTAPVCSANEDSCSGTCCGHNQGSLHYGGTGCLGTSYAVDIAVISPNTEIQSAFNYCSTPEHYGSWGAQLVPEGNHIHIELDGLARTNHCL